MPKLCHLCIRLVWLCHHKMVMMLQKQHIPLWLGDQIAILCVFCRENNLRITFFEKQFTHFFCRENDLRIASGKFLCVEFRHPESSDFLGLWFTLGCFAIHKSSIPSTTPSNKNCQSLSSTSVKSGCMDDKKKPNQTFLKTAIRYMFGAFFKGRSHI